MNEIKLDHIFAEFILRGEGGIFTTPGIDLHPSPLPPGLVTHKFTLSVSVYWCASCGYTMLRRDLHMLHVCLYYVYIVYGVNVYHTLGR